MVGFSEAIAIERGGDTFRARIIRFWGVSFFEAPEPVHSNELAAAMLALGSRNFVPSLQTRQVKTSKWFYAACAEVVREIGRTGAMTVQVCGYRRDQLHVFVLCPVDSCRLHMSRLQKFAAVSSLFLSACLKIEKIDK